MIPEYLHPGDVIGICSPSHVATPDGYAPMIDALESMGYRVRLADYLYADDWGYASSPEDRAADVNQLIRDPEVKLIAFGGGEGAVDVLPLIDWEAAKANPKRWMSYSDGTDLLNTVWSKTGLATFYGMCPHHLAEASAYNLVQFRQMMEAPLPAAHEAARPWHTLVGGACEGTLCGGYLDNFVFLNCAGWVTPPKDEPIVLFIEDHKMFFQIEHESALLGRLEQSPIMPQVVGLLFGHYGDPTDTQLLERLTRLGHKWNIPVAYCDDFGHGENHALLPIGVRARLDTDAQTLTYLP